MVVVVDDHASHCVSLRLPCQAIVLTCQSRSPLVRCCCCLAALLPLSLIAPAVVEAVVLVLVHFSLRLSIVAQQPPCLQLCTDCRLLQRAHICRAGDTFPATQCRPLGGHILKEKTVKTSEEEGISTVLTLTLCNIQTSSCQISS